jgi:hypothetical protein
MIADDWKLLTVIAIGAAWLTATLAIWAMRALEQTDLALQHVELENCLLHAKLSQFIERDLTDGRRNDPAA